MVPRATADLIRQWKMMCDCKQGTEILPGSTSASDMAHTGARRHGYAMPVRPVASAGRAVLPADPVEERVVDVHLDHTRH